MHRFLKYFLLFSFFAYSFTGWAQMFVVEGSISVGFVLSTDKQVIWYRYDSVSLKPQLVSQDAVTGKVLWRKTISSWPLKGTPDGLGAFYFIENECLIKAQLSTGSEMWRVNLSVIPERTYTQPPTLLERAKVKMDQVLHSNAPMPIQIPKFNMGPPNRFVCSQPLISGANLLVSRRALSGSGCVVNLCYTDWLMLDQWKGGLIDGGPGRIVGIHTNDFLTAGQPVFRIRNGAKELIKETGAELEEDFDLFHMGSEALSYRGVTLFCPTRGSQSADVAIVDVSGKVTGHLKPAKDLLQRGWVVLDQGYLHHSEKSDNYSPNKKTADAWLEYFDNTGKLLLTKTVSVGSPDYVKFIGSSTQGKLLLVNGEELHLLSFPSLNTLATVGSQPSTPEGYYSGQAEFHCGRDANIVYRLEGDCTYSELPAKGVEREIVLTAYFTETLKPVWQTKESVILRKKP